MLICGKFLLLPWLGKGVKVKFLEDSKKFETIDKKPGNWFKVDTPDGKVGYLFSGYLRRP